MEISASFVRNESFCISCLRCCGVYTSLANLSTAFFRIASTFSVSTPCKQTASYATGALTTGDYFLRLRGSDRDAAPGEWSAVSGFTILQLPAPALRTVKNAGKGWDFDWDPLEAGVSCQIQIAADPEFGKVILDRTVVKPELRLGPETPLEPGTYYVRVRGVDARQHAGSFSEVASFLVEKPARFPYEFLGVGAVLLMLLL